jgi:uncharacterized protein (DUF1501 family)
MISRRVLLRDTGLALAGLGLSSIVPSASPARRLIVVRQRGGADGLSMVVPWRDAGYYRLRPTIAVPPPGSGAGSAIDLDGAFGLHPRLAPLAPLYRDGTLGVVQGCGQRDGSGSHLAADARLDALLGTTSDGATPAPDSGGQEASGYPSSPFGRALARAALDVKENGDRRRLVVDARGWDHHAGQRETDGPLARSLDDLARGLAALVHDLGDHLATTTIVTVSEFGRAMAENGHGGTEHGRATTMFVIGGGVRRGRVEGAWAGLDRSAPDLRDGLAITFDLADVLRALA